MRVGKQRVELQRALGRRFHAGIVLALFALPVTRDVGISPRDPRVSGGEVWVLRNGLLEKGHTFRRFEAASPLQLLTALEVEIVSFEIGFIATLAPA